MRDEGQGGVGISDTPTIEGTLPVMCDRIDGGITGVSPPTPAQDYLGISVIDHHPPSVAPNVPCLLPKVDKDTVMLS